MTKAKYSFTVTAILDAANTIEAADKLRALLEANGFEQTSCECGGVMLGPKTVHSRFETLNFDAISRPVIVSINETGNILKETK